jgi:hypothetical protein
MKKLQASFDTGKSFEIAFKCLSNVSFNNSRDPQKLESLFKQFGIFSIVYRVFAAFKNHSVYFNESQSV